MNFRKKIRLFVKYHLASNPSMGPLSEKELGIYPLQVDMDNYYENIKQYSTNFSISVLSEINHKRKKHPIFYIKSKYSANRKKLLVVSAVHGNEQATILAIPKILEDIVNNPDIYRGVEVSFIAPANPVGAACFSRYNAKGFDINRDFSKFETEEARLIKKIVVDTNPDFVIGLHEGPQKGTFLYTNKLVSKEFVLPILKYLSTNKIPLANIDYFGRRLKVSGYSPITGMFYVIVYLWKTVLQKTTLSAFLTDLKIPEITVESCFRSQKGKERINSHVLTVRAVVDQLCD